MTPDTWQRWAPIVAALSNLVGAAIFSIGALRSSRFRAGFSLMAIAALLFTLSNFFWVAVCFDQTRGTSFLSRDTFIHLFPVQALCAYVAVPVIMLGSGILVWQTSIRDSNRNI
jgi:hypothetical protein